MWGTPVFHDKQTWQISNAVLRIITIQILQVMVILGEYPLLELVYLNKYSIPTKPKTGSSPLDLSDLSDQAEILIVYSKKLKSPC